MTFVKNLIALSRVPSFLALQLSLVHGRSQRWVNSSLWPLHRVIEIIVAAPPHLYFEMGACQTERWCETRSLEAVLPNSQCGDDAFPRKLVEVAMDTLGPSLLHGPLSGKGFLAHIGRLGFRGQGRLCS